MTFADIIKKIRVRKYTFGRPFISAVFPFMGGLLCAWCLCLITANCIAGRTADLMLLEAENADKIRPASGRHVPEDFRLLVSEDPFGAKKVQEAKKEGNNTAASLKLAGTLSHTAAYLDGGTGAELILKGQDYMGFRLVSIGPGEAEIEKDGKRTVIYMPLTSAGGSVAPASSKPSRAKNIWNSPRPKTVSLPGVQPASPGTAGSVPRELVEKLLLNPYEEMAKIRMIPSENGMKIARIAGDSVLASVGVQKEDVIKAVNGVNITNLGDATNAINSMMTGNRFDVTVERGGAPVELSYEVR